MSETQETSQEPEDDDLNPAEDTLSSASLIRFITHLHNSHRVSFFLCY